MNKHICGNDILKIKLTGSDNQVSVSSGRAMKIVFELTSGGKVINGRIYTPKGLTGSMDSWTKPWGKPIQVFHDSNRDAIGRISSVNLEDTQEEALAHLGGDYKALAEIVAAYDSNDPQKIYKSMSKYRLLNDKRWPGLVRMMAEARITDADAIQKFQDERYLTLSAGQNFHQVVCGIDGQDWYEAPCEHTPAILSPGDKDATVFVIPSMDGREASVVNDPANNTSYVREKIVGGFDTQITEMFSREIEDAQGLLISTDGQYQVEVDYDPIGWDQLRLLSPKIVAGLVASNTLKIEGLDQFPGVPDKGFLQSVYVLLETSDSEAALAFKTLVSQSSEDEMNKEMFDQLMARLAALEEKVQTPAPQEPADSQTPVVEPEVCECGKPKGPECVCKSQLEADYAQALATVDQLKTKMLSVLQVLAEIRGTTLDSSLQAHLDWFDAGALAPAATSVPDSEQIIDTPGISQTGNGVDAVAEAKVPGDNPPPKASETEIDSYTRFVLDRARKLKASRGTDTAKQYLTAQRQYLRPGTDLLELYKLIGD
jgi:hypothetical protein